MREIFFPQPEPPKRQGALGIPVGKVIDEGKTEALYASEDGLPYLLRKALKMTKIPSYLTTTRDQSGQVERYLLGSEDLIRRGVALGVDMEKLFSWVNQFLLEKEMER